MSFFRSFALLLAFFVCSSTFAQTKPAPNNAQPDTSRVKQYTYVETMPVFPGGNPAFMKLLTDSLHYPARALRDQVQGKVYLSFTIDATGSLTDTFVKQGIRPDLDAEALRLLRRLAPIRWQPGTQNGRPVAVVYTMPLTFRLQPTTSPAADSLDTDGGKALTLPMSSWPMSQADLPTDKGIIYGSCIQRLGFDSGGFGQYVRLINLATHKAVRIKVKPDFRSRRENEFCYALPPGRYALHSYEFTASKWYGGQIHTESLRKPGAATATLADTRYIFTVQPGQVQYVGTWDFAQPQQPTFTDAKARLDGKVQASFKHQNLADALTTLPK